MSMRRAIAVFLLVASPAATRADFLVVTDWSNDRVVTLDPITGAVINANLIVDSARLDSPKAAIDSGRGTLLVADQIADAVFEYAQTGEFLRIITNNATSGIDNIRGIAVRNGELYITVGSGTFANTVQRFTLEGVRVGTFISTNLDSPFDIAFRANDVLVSNSGNDSIHRFDLAGNSLGALVTSDGVNGVDFPQQIHLAADGTLLVGGFSPPAGIYRYSATGTQLNFYNVNTGVRGAYELPSGLILYTDGTGIRSFNPATNATSLILGGGNFQYIALVVPEPSGMASLMLGIAVAAMARRGVRACRARGIAAD